MMIIRKIKQINTTAHGTFHLYHGKVEEYTSPSRKVYTFMNGVDGEFKRYDIVFIMENISVNDTDEDETYYNYKCIGYTYEDLTDITIAKKAIGKITNRRIIQTLSNLEDIILNYERTGSIDA